MKTNVKKGIIITMVVLVIVSTLMLCASITKNENVKLAFTNIRQTIAGQQNVAMKISGKVITQNAKDQHIATVKLYKVNSRDSQQLVLTKNTEVNKSNRKNFKFKKLYKR